MNLFLNWGWYCSQKLTWPIGPLKIGSFWPSKRSPWQAVKLFVFREGTTSKKSSQDGRKWLITTVSFRPLSRVVGPLPNGRTSWLKNMGVILTTYIHWMILQVCMLLHLEVRSVPFKHPVASLKRRGFSLSRPAYPTQA